MAETVLFRAKTHTTNGKNGRAQSADGFLSVDLPEPHPAAENMFGAAWSACYMGALELAANQRKIRLGGQLAVDAEIELARDASGFFLRATLSVTVPGVERSQAQELVDAAHLICPYSKAVHGNINVVTKLA